MSTDALESADGIGAWWEGGRVIVVNSDLSADDQRFLSVYICAELQRLRVDPRGATSVHIPRGGMTAVRREFELSPSEDIPATPDPRIPTDPLPVLAPALAVPAVIGQARHRRPPQQRSGRHRRP